MFGKNRISQAVTITSIIFIVIVVGTTLKLTSAWVEPDVAPPGGNIAAPLNTSSYGQTKSGGLILNTLGAAYGLLVDNGNVGIGAQTPNQKLEVAGAIKIGNTDSPEPGTIRWNGNNFEGFNGEEWISFHIIEADRSGQLCGYSVKTDERSPDPCRGIPPDIYYTDYIKCQDVYPSQGCPEGYSVLIVGLNVWCSKD